MGKLTRRGVVATGLAALASPARAQEPVETVASVVSNATFAGAVLLSM